MKLWQTKHTNSGYIQTQNNKSCLLRLLAAFALYTIVCWQIKLSIQKELKKGLDDFYLKNRTNYFQEHNRKEKDAKAEEKLDGLLTQAIKFNLQEGLSKDEGNRR